MAGEPDFKKGKRHVDPDVFKRLHAKPSGCEMALYHPYRCDGVLSLHHVLPKGAPYFGDDTEVNLVKLCGSGTTGHHGEVEANREWAMRALGDLLVRRRRDILGYVEGKLGVVAGQDWLARHLFIERGTP